MNIERVMALVLFGRIVPFDRIVIVEIIMAIGTIETIDTKGKLYL